MNGKFAKLGFTTLLVFALTALIVGVVFASTPSSPTSDNGIVPYIVDNPGPGGNVTCTQLGYDFSSARSNYDKDTDSFDAAFPAGVDVTVTEDTYVAWTSTFPIGAVIVKGSNDANIYEYDGGSLSDSGLASPVNASNGSAGLSNLTFCWNLALEVSKTAETTYDRDWDWTIEKTGDQSSLTLSPGQTFIVNYDVTVDASYEDSNWAVSGTIAVYNPNSSASATITSVSDEISDGIVADVVCGVTFPYALAAKQTLNCTYSADLPDGSDRTNTATASTSGKVPGGSGEADVTFGDPTNESDECVNVNDDKFGALGVVCASEAPKTFEYSLNVGSYETCGDYTYVNTATFTTNDTETTGSDDHTVNVTVPCAGGCTLTQGYWKTHSENGPAPYDNVWALLPSGASTPFFLSGQTWLGVFWTAPAGNAYYILADQYMAAKLNILNGASAPQAVTTAIGNAEAFFNAKTPLSTLTKAQRAQILTLAATLDQYNNGLIGPGHCSE